MVSSTENVKLGVCSVLFGGVDLGFTKGGVEVEVLTTTHEVKVDQLGETPINEYLTGRTVTVKVPLAETTLENMIKVMPGATLITDGVDTSRKKVTISTSISLPLLEIAQPLILRPKGTTGEDDFTVYRAACPGALNFAYKLDDERVFMANFKGYADDESALFVVGDYSASGAVPDPIIYLSNNSVDDTAAPGTVIGALTVSPIGSNSWTFSMTDDASGMFALSGSNLIVGLAALDHDTSPSPSVSVSATNGAITVTRTFVITVNEGGMVTIADILVSMHAKDGSQGDTYTAPAGMTNIQWYRRSLAAPYEQIAIAGHTGASYVTGADDGPDVATPVKTRFRMVAQGDLDGKRVNAVSLQEVLPAPIVIWAADSFVSSNTPIPPVIDTNLKVYGAGSIMLTGNGASQGGYVQSEPTAESYSADDLDVLAGAIILPDTTEFQNVTSYGLRPQIGASGFVSDLPGLTLNDSQRGVVWHGAAARASATLAAAGSGAVSLRVLPGQAGATSGSPYAAKPRIDVVAAHAGGVPTLNISCDDGDRSLLDTFIPLCAARNIPVTHFLALGKMGTQNFATLAEWQAAKDQYGDLLQIGINGTAMDDDMTTGSPTGSRIGMAAVIPGLQADISAAVAAGFPIDDLLHGCYPMGAVRSVPTVYRDQAAVFTAGSDSVTLSAAISGIAVGMTVAAYGSPVGNKVKSYDGALALVLEQPVTIAGTRPISMQDMSGEFVFPKLPDALSAIGIRSMRATAGFSRLHSRFGMDKRWMRIPAGSGSIISQTNEALLAALNSNKEEIKTHKCSGYQYFHIANDSSSSNLRTPVDAVLIPYLDGIASDVQSQALTVLTHTNTWKRDAGSAFPQ